jgi:hypothetical protein
MDDRIFDNAEENVLNSTQIHDATDSTIKMATTITISLDKPASESKLTLRWSNITEVAARTFHIFSTECQSNEIPRSGTWLVGSAQYISLLL